MPDPILNALHNKLIFSSQHPKEVTIIYALKISYLSMETLATVPRHADVGSIFEYMKSGSKITMLLHLIFILIL